MLLVLVVPTLVIRRINASLYELVAPEAESLHQRDQLRRQINELDSSLFAETALAIKLANAGTAHDVVEAVRALLRLHVRNHEREANAASEQLLERDDFVVDFVVGETVRIT